MGGVAIGAGATSGFRIVARCRSLHFVLDDVRERLAGVSADGVAITHQTRARATSDDTTSPTTNARSEVAFVAPRAAESVRDRRDREESRAREPRARECRDDGECDGVVRGPDGGSQEQMEWRREREPRR
jgi:hypothetical protein